MNEYQFEILIWLILIFIGFIAVKIIPNKMKLAKDQQTKNSFFTLLMIIIIPILIIVVIGPIILIMGDKNMPGMYKIIYAVTAVILIIYSISIQVHKKK